VDFYTNTLLIYLIHKMNKFLCYEFCPGSMLYDLILADYSVRGSYYTTLSYDVIHDVFVLFTFAKVEVIWFDTLVSGQSLGLLRFAY